MKTTMAVTDVIQKGMQELKSKFEEFHQDHLFLATGENPEGKETVDGDATSGLDGNRLRSTEEEDLSRKFDFLKKLLLAEMESHRTHDDSEADLLRAIGTKLETLEHEFVKWKIPVTIECPVHDDLDHILPCICTVSCFQNNEEEEDHDDDDHGDIVDKEGMFEESPAVEAEDGDVLPLLEEEEEEEVKNDVKKTKKWSLGYRMLMAFLLVLFSAIIRIAVIEGDEYDEFLVPT